MYVCDEISQMATSDHSSVAEGSEEKNQYPHHKEGQNAASSDGDKNSLADDTALKDDTPPVSYNLKLFCSAEKKEPRSTEIIIPHTPRTISDIKQCVETKFSIPVCCQQMIFESHKLRNQDSVKELRIREGDTLIINYTSEAMVEDIREIIQEMKKMRHFLQRKDIQKHLADGSDPNGEISTNIDDKNARLLFSNYFKQPSIYETSKANRLFFITNHGLQTMHLLHEELLMCPWNNCKPKMQSLEYAILRILWNISAGFSIRELLLQQPTLEATMKSFLRIEISPDKPIPSRTRADQEINIWLIYTALVVIGNLSEIPECRVTIASRRDVLDQLLATLTCPSFSYIVAQVTAACLLCLSYSPETHQYLVTENVILMFERACSVKKGYTYSFKDEELLRYFQNLFYAQLLCASASKISLDLKHKMYVSIKRFLETANHKLIRDYEKEKDFIWSTVTPFVKLAYLPKQNPQWSFRSPENPDNEFLQELEELCIEIGVFSMQNMLISDETREFLVAEALLDYTVCLPWHLSPETKAHRRACDLRDFLSQKMRLQPPSLVNLTKAKLAATHCGLDRVLKATSLHDIIENIVGVSA